MQNETLETLEALDFVARLLAHVCLARIARFAPGFFLRRRGRLQLKPQTPSVTVIVGPNSTAAIEDVLGTLFGSKLAPWGIPAGGLMITSDVAVSVISRTYVANGLSATGVPGTYGFSIPGTPSGVSAAIGDSGRAGGFHHRQRDLLPQLRSRQQDQLFPRQRRVGGALHGR